MKPILDACCGGKMFYFDKHDSRVLFQDIRDMETTLCDGRHFEVRPDVQADFTDMPYPNDSFSMVVFDPPHLKCSENQKSISGYQMIKYGALSKGWRDMLYKGFSECFRVLKPGGVPYIQMERNRHQGIRGSQAGSGEAGLRPHIRKEKQYALDLFYERR